MKKKRDEATSTNTSHWVETTAGDLGDKQSDSYVFISKYLKGPENSNSASLLA